MVHFLVLFLSLPVLMTAAPVEEGLKQQIAAAGYLRNEEPQWSFLNPDNPGIEVQTRSLDSLGRGHILRSLGEGDSSWLGGGNGGGNFGWRFNGVSGGLKRGSGLDSLGRGNILRYIPDDTLQRYFKSLDSLGRGNILKRSTRDSR